MLYQILDHKIVDPFMLGMLPEDAREPILQTVDAFATLHPGFRIFRQPLINVIIRPVHFNTLLPDVLNDDPKMLLWIYSFHVSIFVRVNAP